MKIIVLDGFAANPGDLSWEGIKALGECVIYDRTAPEEVLERAAGAEVLLTNKVIINAEHMAALPELKYIGVLATGYNVVDTVAAKERGIVVTNIPSYSTASVAQMVFAHILNISQQVQHHSEEVHSLHTLANLVCFTRRGFEHAPVKPLIQKLINEHARYDDDPSFNEHLNDPCGNILLIKKSLHELSSSRLRAEIKLQGKNSTLARQFMDAKVLSYAMQKNLYN